MPASLKLRRATVVQAEPVDGPEQSLTIDLEGQRRAAICDVTLLAHCEAGDEVVVNVQGLDLGLGSGGFDVVHVNLTRGLQGRGVDGAHVMKLPYTSLQHAVLPVDGPDLQLPFAQPIAVAALHGQLPAVAWAFAQCAPGLSLGYVHTPGGALVGGHSRVVRKLRERGLLAGCVSAGAAFGGEQEAITTAGALHHGLCELGWDAAVCGPGPGIVGSASALGHGGMQALDSAHVALALGAPTVLVARASLRDPRPRHHGISHHTLTVLDLLLAPVVIALPSAGSDDEEKELVVPAETTARHDWRRVPVDLAGYRDSGLPTVNMGRTLQEDPVFFGTSLAAGAVLADLADVDDGEAP
ncbi:MAG TPA: DUF3866 family protein [Solirubrobacteraceae bacterium]|jgi:hypothetical protein